MKYNDPWMLDNQMVKICEQVSETAGSYLGYETTSVVIWDRFISGTSLFRQPWYNRLQNIRSDK